MFKTSKTKRLRIVEMRGLIKPYVLKTSKTKSYEARRSETSKSQLKTSKTKSSDFLEYCCLGVWLKTSKTKSIIHYYILD